MLTTTTAKEKWLICYSLNDAVLPSTNEGILRIGRQIHWLFSIEGNTSRTNFLYRLAMEHRRDANVLVMDSGIYKDVYLPPPIVHCCVLHRATLHVHTAAVIVSACSRNY